MTAGGERSPAAERSIEFADDVAEIRIGRRPDLELRCPSRRCRRCTRAWSASARATAARRGRDDKPLDTWLVEDMGSKNGTFIGNQRLERGAQRAITAGTRIALAHVNLVFDGPSPRVTGGGGDRDHRAPAGERPVPGGARDQRADADGGGGPVERQRSPAGRARQGLHRRTIQELRAVHQGARAVARARRVHARIEWRRGPRPRLEERRSGQRRDGERDAALRTAT